MIWQQDMKNSSSARLAAAAAVHLLTASGAICGLLALHFAAAGAWQSVFSWAGLALIVDALDGPLARKLEVKSVLPRFDGARLDQTVDYLNYCVVPAFVILQSGIFENWLATLVAGGVVVSSLYHFADSSSKTADGYFVGFPALWNIACFYLFVFAPGTEAAVGLILTLGVLTFIPAKWVHPFRVKRFRSITTTVVGCWGLAAIHVVLTGFPGTPGVQIVLAAATTYLVALGLARTLGFGAAGEG